MNDPAKQLQEFGVSPWLDNITRAMLRDGTRINQRFPNISVAETCAST